MNRADVTLMEQRIAERLPGAVCRPLWNGPGGYLLVGHQANGQAFEIKRKSDLNRIAPKRRTRAQR